MSFQSTLRDHLLADATIAAMVGTRIYPTALPDNAVLPAVTYFRAGGRTEQKPMPVSAGTTRNFLVQIQAVGGSYDEADRLEEAILSRMDVDTSTLKSRPLGETQDLYDEATKRYITATSFSCWYTPT